MMNGTKKSDSSIVPAKPANKAERSTAELVEGDDGTKRNAELQSTGRTQGREAVTQAQARIRGAVTRNEKEKLTALLHHISIDVLRWAFFNIKKQAAPGVDGLTWVDYAADLDRNLTDLHARVHSGAYRALPSRRRYIPKADGKQRPLGIAALEDKIVQAAVVAILTPIYEAEFLGFSYGFRPGRGQHDALDALAYGINARKINWILDADISRFFDTLSREWLIRFVEHRIGDRRIIRLIQKWLKAGVLEDGRLIETTEGTPQGSVASPLLGNVYLHYVYDLWVEQWRTRHAKGDMIVVRYADDTIVGFQHRQDAERFQIDLKERLAKFALSLHPEKTRLIEFGRYAAGRRAERGQGWHRHTPIDEQGRWLGAMMKGHFAYFAVPTNTYLLSAFRYHTSIIWFRSLRRRSQRHRLTWERMVRLIKRFLPSPRVLHPWPNHRFNVKYSR